MLAIFKLHYFESYQYKALFLPKLNIPNLVPQLHFSFMWSLHSMVGHSLHLEGSV